MKTVIPSAITNLSEAKAFLKALKTNNESFHPDDSPSEIIDRQGKPLFTKKEAKLVDKAMEQVWEQFNGANACPSGYYLLMEFADTRKTLTDLQEIGKKMVELGGDEPTYPIKALHVYTTSSDGEYFVEEDPSGGFGFPCGNMEYQFATIEEAEEKLYEVAD